uniref:ubiquitinyl hydrolase 1 n=1 Tax=Heterorhabditis bacteriophora TaxID=37862 RepID=A0A1I7XR31_HETBA
MWGLHDRQLTLREALYEMLVRGSRRIALWRRWKWAEHKANQATGLSLTLSDEEWMQEWNGIVVLAAPVPRKNDDAGSDSTDQIYESLEAIHVFALAHVLKRPIIVVSDTVDHNFSTHNSNCNVIIIISVLEIIPITDANRNLLPVHFAVDPGPDFSCEIRRRWRDEEDVGIAARLDLADSDKLALMSEYMDLVRMDVRRGSVKKTRPIRTSTGASSIEKSMTLASSGVAGGSQEKKRIINEITQQFLRTFRLSNGKNKDSGIDARMCATDLSRSNCVIASRLVSSSHEYMEEMVREYMKTARERFQISKTIPYPRKRISRSFSASSLTVTCINQFCNKQALQSNNFLCHECFEHQKEQMTSFNYDNPNLMKPLPLPPTSKSTTMPSIATNAKRSMSRDTLRRPAPVLGVTKEGFSTTTRQVGY